MRTRISMLLVACVACRVLGQEALSAKRIVTRTISPGVTDSFTLALNDGDYARFSLTQHGRLAVVWSSPDGAPLGRSAAGTNVEASRHFALAADGEGRYRIGIANRGRDTATYELSIEDILPLSERLKPEVLFW